MSAIDDLRIEALEKRVSALEEAEEDVRDQLAAGATQFAVLGAKLDHLADKVAALIGVLSWVGGAIAIGVLGVAGTSLVWVIQRMGAT